MDKEKVFRDQFGDSLAVVKGELNTGVLLINESAEGNVGVSVWLTDSQKWELIEFLSR